MSGQCLSPNDAGHALTPATHRCLGEPLPHQLASTASAAPQTAHLCSVEIIRYYLQFPAAIPDLRVRSDVLLPRLPLLRLPEGKLVARLACLIHAANVHSEPGSNPSLDCLNSRLSPRKAPGNRVIAEKRVDLIWSSPATSRRRPPTRNQELRLNQHANVSLNS